MQEDDTITLFSSRLRGIANKPFQREEEYPYEKHVRKALRCLPTRFNAKVAAIEKAKDATKLSLDDLLGSLQTYEMSVSALSKDKDIALIAEMSTPNNTHYFEDEIIKLT